MRNKKWGALAIGFLTLLGLSNEAQAMPMFGKQTGLDCTACHLQHMPKLNAVGRSFAASGMTQGKKNSDANSSGMDLYASVMVKAMYEETWDKPSADGLIKDNVTPTAGGEWSVPRTASLYVGGKLSENVGALIDLSYKDAEDNSIQGKVVYAKEIENGYLGAVAYSSASFGPFSGMETYNTGLYKPLRTFDIKKLSNAFQASEIGTGAATGMQIYYDKDKMFTSDDHLFVTGGVYTPIQDNADMQMRENILPFARVAYEFPVSDFNFVLGGFGIVGGWQVSSTEPLSMERETYGIDFQVEGMIAEKSVSLILSKVLKNEVTYTGIGSNANNPAEYINLRNTAFSAEGEVNLTPEIGFKVGYLTFDDRYLYKTQNSHNNVKDIDHAYTVGVDYSFNAYFPMKLAIEHAWAKPSLDSVAEYRDFLVSLNILY